MRERDFVYNTTSSLYRMDSDEDEWAVLTEPIEESVEYAMFFKLSSTPEIRQAKAEL